MKTNKKYFKEGYNWFELNYRKYVGLYTYIIKHSTKLKQKEQQSQI